jgi:tRNA threonylcarbamoyl adenosine modification protein YjeE
MTTSAAADPYRVETTTTSEKATAAFASSLASQLQAPLLLTLEGPLGAGKTAFCRGFVAGLPGGAGVVVQSPTYALMRRYPTTPPVQHLDLYRLHESGVDPLESLEALGVLDSLDEGFSLVEWPPAHTRWPIPSGAVRITVLSARRRRIEVEIPFAAPGCGGIVAASRGDLT